LTVTDNVGATTTVTNPVAATPPPPNQPPTARFTWTCTELTCDMDATTSSDPEDIVTGYSWDLGDGSQDDRATLSHTFASAGTYDVALVVTDGELTASVTHQVTVPVHPNRLPVAVFSSSCVGLVCSFDAGGSADVDGSVVSYGWSFGDGGVGSGVSVSHTYAVGGPVAVTLTVTDERGGSSSVMQGVSPVSPVVSPFVSDGFGRTVQGGLGVADVGGAWSVVGSAAQVSVSPGAAVVALARASQQVEGFVGPARTDADVVAVLSASRVPVGGPLYLTVTPRRVSASAMYGARVWVNANGSVSVRLVRAVGGVSTTVGSAVTVPGVTYTAGLSLSVRVQAFGTGPTTLRARVWRTGQVEPGTWQVSATDSTAGLQSAGVVGTTAVLSSAVTNTPVAVTITSFTARPAG